MERRMPITETRPASGVLLENGDRMDAVEFMRRYELDDRKCELIGGVVHVASPTRSPHGACVSLLDYVLNMYAEATPGVDASAAPTVRLGPEDVPEPDLLLRLTRDGGSRIDSGEYLAGPPELVLEVAHSSAAIDLHDKKDCYARHGCREYAVALIDEGEVRWFSLIGGRRGPSYRTLPARDGVVRSRQFPGLWLDAPALFARDRTRLSGTLRQGLATAEHARFVRRLAGA